MNKTLLLRGVLCALLLAPIAPILPPAGAQSAPAPSAPQNARVIVKYKADATLLRKRALSAHDQHAVQAQALGLRHGLLLRAGAGVHERSHVVFASGMSSEQLAAKLSLDSEVEYAVPDKRKRAAVAATDPRYVTVAGNGPASGQWYLRPNVAGVLSSIDVEPAWDITLGSSNIVVAVLDTGVRFEHPDLKTLANGGNLLAGYDMVSEAPYANDGDGRDPDASDPGDWVTAAENASGLFQGCGTVHSEWHGTQVAGLIGALTNNGEGMASVGRTLRVLPVRVLGKCGGFDSDIIAGMYWAANLNGAGGPASPPNPTPARVINLSLGGSGACTQAYQEAVNQIAAAGVTIVASAGNSEGHAVDSPANCAGVMAVSGLRHIGTKVGFSSLGPEVSISAPGGNCVNTGATEPCLYPILTSSNSGLTSPVASIYTDHFNTSIGTSYSAPLVAGSAALLLSVQPNLTPSEVRTILRSTARPFPKSGSDPDTPICHAPDGNVQDECYCTTSTCGEGMLDAGAAVRLASLGVLPRITLSPATAVVGQVLSLGGATSLVGSGRTASYQWTIVDNGGIVTAFSGPTNAVNTSITPTGVGQFSVRLTVTDDLGAQATTVSNIAVTNGVAPRITFNPANPLARDPVFLSATGSTVLAGRSITNYQWNIVNNGGVVTGFSGTTVASTATIVPNAAGQFSVSLTITDSTGAQATTTGTISVAAPPRTGGSSGGGALGGTWLALLSAAVLALARRRR